MPIKYYAHTPAEGSDCWQFLEVHLNEVARLASNFAECFGERELGHYIGLLHDLGKASDKFQNYLLKCYEAKQRGDKAPVSKTDHKVAGAMQARQAGGHTSLLANGGIIGPTSLPMIRHLRLALPKMPQCSQYFRTR